MAGNIIIGLITEIPIYEGRNNSDSYTIAITIDGATYEVYARRENGSVKLPTELQDHPLAPEIKALAGMALLDKFIFGIEAERRTRVDSVGRMRINGAR